MTTVVELDHVTRRYRTSAGVVTAVDEVSWAIPSGAVVGVAGPSGSGKTTLLHLIAGWETADAGRLVRASTTVDGLTGMAVVPQGIGLLPDLTIGENVAIAGALAARGGRPAGDTSALLDRLGLADLVDRAPDQVSLGQQQRAAVARAVVVTPLLLVADEPTAHQDEANASLVIDELRRCAAAGCAVIVSSHDERVLAELDIVVRMVDGRLVSDTGPTRG